MPQTLLVVFGEAVALHLLDYEVEGSVNLDQQVFSDATSGSWEGWAGFYDWLRTSDGTVVGVRAWLNVLEADDARAVRQALRTNAAVELSADEVRIWFSECRDFDKWRSDDQDLGTHRVMRSREGTLAMTFAVDELSLPELATLAEHVS